VTFPVSQPAPNDRDRLKLLSRLRGYPESKFYFLELLLRSRGQWTIWKEDDAMSIIDSFLSLLKPSPASLLTPPVVEKPNVAPAVAPAPVHASPLPEDALTFVETEEDGSPAYYVKTEAHWDWPGGISGPTIGVGYDLGQVTRAEAIADWTGIVDAATLALIIVPVGFQGAQAQAFVRAHHDEITITWNQAITEFKVREIPKWLTRCRAALPNFDLLHGDCQGALFSLTYNRGPGGYSDNIHPRNREMYAIKQAMVAKNFKAIPALILAQQYLWPAVKDLRDRRAHEAVLFQKGIDAAA
jgi:hypothetical protein